MARGAVVTDTLPNGVVFSPLGSDPGVSTNGTGAVLYDVPTLAPGAIAAFEIAVLALTNVASQITNTAVVVTTGDSNPTNDLALAATHFPDFDEDGQYDFVDPDDDDDQCPTRKKHSQIPTPGMRIHSSG